MTSKQAAARVYARIRKETKDRQVPYWEQAPTWIRRLAHACYLQGQIDYDMGKDE
jgi:hypothetical protein